MKVSEFIEFLKKQEPEMEVAYRCCSEQVLLDVEDIEVVDGCPPRPDGWIQNCRPDMPSSRYLLLPGN